MSGPAGDEASDWNNLAHAKLVRVFGASEAKTVQLRVMKRLGIDRLSSVEDLYRFSRTLSRDPDPIAAAVGGLLGVTALLRGAEGDSAS